MPQYESLQPEVFRTTLENGLTVVVQPLRGVASVSVGLNLVSGSRDESSREAGLSHLVEHMLFQGTQRRDMRELSRILNAVGGNLDACTGRESTTLYAKIPHQHLGLAMDVMADMLQHSCFAPANLAKEKKVILEEIRMIEDTPDEFVNDLLQQALWPRHPLGRSILGTSRNLRALRPKGLKDFYQRHYQPERLILAVAGKVTPTLALRLARQYFGGLPSRPTLDPLGPAASRALRQCLIRRRSLEQVHVCLGVPGMAYADPQRLAGLALINILGGGPNSRLFYEVRERRALAYALYAYMDFFRDTGMAGIYLACHPRKLRETLEVVQDQLAGLIRKGVTRSEWRDVREQMKGNYLISLESTSSHMWHLIQQETYLQQHPGLASSLREIEQLSPADLQAAAHHLFKGQALALALVGPVEPKPWMHLQLPS